MPEATKWIFANLDRAYAEEQDSAARENMLFAACLVGIAAIFERNRRMGIPSRPAGIRRENIPVMAVHADREANPLYPVPVLMDARALAQFNQQVTEEV